MALTDIFKKMTEQNQKSATQKDPNTKRQTNVPMGGGFLEQYGIFSPSQKEAMADQQAQMMAMQQAMLSPQQNANYMMSMGGSMLGKSLGQFLNKRNQPTAQASPQASAQDDFARLVDSTGGDVSKAMLVYGQQLLQSGDPTMQAAGIKMLQDAQAQMLEKQKDEATIAKDSSQAQQNQASTRKLGVEANQLETGDVPIKNGTTETFWTERGARQMMYDAKKKAWVEMGRGDRNPRQEIVQGTPDDFRTKTQKGEDQQAYEDLRIQGRGIVRAVDNIINELTRNEGAAGVSGDILLKGKDIIDTAKSLGATLTGTEAKAPSVDKLDWKGFEKAAAGRAYTKAEVADAAYAYAAVIYGQKGRDVTNADVQRVLDRMGSAYSDPKLGIKLMKDLKTKVNLRLNDFAEVKKFDKDPFFSGQEDPTPQERREGTSSKYPEGTIIQNASGEQMVRKGGKWVKK